MEKHVSIFIKSKINESYPSLNGEYLFVRCSKLGDLILVGKVNISSVWTPFHKERDIVIFGFFLSGSPQDLKTR